MSRPVLQQRRVTRGSKPPSILTVGFSKQVAAVPAVAPPVSVPSAKQKTPPPSQSPVQSESDGTSEHSSSDNDQASDSEQQHSLHGSKAKGVAPPVASAKKKTPPPSQSPVQSESDGTSVHSSSDNDQAWDLKNKSRRVDLTLSPREEYEIPPWSTAAAAAEPAELSPAAAAAAPASAAGAAQTLTDLFDHDDDVKRMSSISAREELRIRVLKLESMSDSAMLKQVRLLYSYTHLQRGLMKAMKWPRNTAATRINKWIEAAYQDTAFGTSILKQIKHDAHRMFDLFSEPADSDEWWPSVLDDLDKASTDSGASIKFLISSLTTINLYIAGLKQKYPNEAGRLKVIKDYLVNRWNSRQLEMHFSSEGILRIPKKRKKEENSKAGSGSEEDEEDDEKDTVTREREPTSEREQDEQMDEAQQMDEDESDDASQVVDSEPKQSGQDNKAAPAAAAAAAASAASSSSGGKPSYFKSKRKSSSNNGSLPAPRALACRPAGAASRRGLADREC